MSFSTVLANLKADIESAIATYSDRQPPTELINSYANLSGAIASTGTESVDPSQIRFLTNDDASESAATLIKWQPPTGKRWEVLYIQGALESASAAGVSIAVSYNNEVIAWQVCPGTASTGSNLFLTASQDAAAIVAAGYSSTPLPKIAQNLTEDFEIGMQATAGTLSTIFAAIAVIERDA